MVTLRKITADNLWDIVALKVGDSQRTFVADNTRSILEAYVAITSGGTALPFGIYAGEMPVGFLMLSYGCEDWPDAPAIAHDNYSLWRLMIDEKHQGKGYGKAAVEAALAYIRTLPCGPATHCWLSYEPENTVAKKLYASFGFQETGDRDENEIIAALML
ncbi:MAG: GNAT family N-acetyltransferase [Clostridiales bacterium]|nr:GNAT family N-acetyltransferase [Clostridiales bacterium]